MSTVELALAAGQPLKALTLAKNRKLSSDLKLKIVRLNLFEAPILAQELLAEVLNHFKDTLPANQYNQCLESTITDLHEYFEPNHFKSFLSTLQKSHKSRSAALRILNKLALLEADVERAYLSRFVQKESKTPSRLRI